MLNKSVRVPQELLDKIDEYVYVKQYYSTRTDFFLSSMRQLVATYAQKKKEVMEQYKTPSTKDVIEQTFRSITELYLRSFKRYSGETTQINLNTPEGLWNQIEKLLKREYGYERKADFPRASIMCLLFHLDEVESILDDTEKFMQEQMQLRAEIYKYVQEGLEKNMSPADIINTTFDKMVAKKKHSGRQ